MSTTNDVIFIGVSTGTNNIPRVYKSYNNGSNWIPIIYSGIDSSTIYSLEVKDSIVLCGTYKGVYISRNSGINWRRIPEINPNIGLFGLSIIDEKNIIISSYGYGIQVSTNGGNSWNFRNEGINYGEYYPRALYSSGDFTYMGTGAWNYLPAVFRRSTSQLIPVIENNTVIPKDIKLSKNYPNPFNPSTKIRFSIANGFPVRTSGNDKVVLKVYDVMGREVQTLVNESLKPGTYEVTFDGSAFTSGVYFYKLQCGDFVQTNRMVLIK